MTTRTAAIRSNTDELVMVLLYASAASIPFLFGHPQLVVGSVVNMLLVLAASRLPRRHWLPLAVLPSLAALARGLVFGPFTPFLLFFLPFIWLGNLALMLALRRLRHWPVGLALLPAAALKASLLYGMALVYVQADLVPEMFLTAMGLIQLETALLGGLAGVGFLALMDRTT